MAFMALSVTEGPLSMTKNEATGSIVDTLTNQEAGFNLRWQMNHPNTTMSPLVFLTSLCEFCI